MVGGAAGGVLGGGVAVLRGEGGARLAGGGVAGGRVVSGGGVELRGDGAAADGRGAGIGGRGAWTDVVAPGVVPGSGADGEGVRGSGGENGRPGGGAVAGGAEAVVGFLATAAMGAVWVPVEGDGAAVAAVRPKLFLATDLEGMERVHGLAGAMPGLAQVLVVGLRERSPDLRGLPWRQRHI